MNKGILYMILSGMCFIVVNFFVKLMGAGAQLEILPEIQSFPAHELVLARSIVSFVISFAVIKHRKLALFGVNKKWLIIRGVAGTIALTIFFYTIHYLPLAIATTVQYLAPIFTVIFAIVLLKEKVKTLQWFFIALSFLGVSLIGLDKLVETTKATESISYLWLGLGILSAVFSGIAYVAILKLKATDAPIVIVSYFPMIAIPVMIVFCLFEFTMPQGIEWLLLLIIGIFTQFAQILLTKAFHEGTASTITPFQYLGAIYAFLIGYFVFDETLSMIVNIGIVMVVGGVFINALIKKKKSLI
jgi:drug/metabolite transporter (DMT)-like permease